MIFASKCSFEPATSTATFTSRTAMGEHWLVDYIADGKDTRNIRTHLLVDCDKCALGDGYTGGLRANHFANGPTATSR